MRVSCRERERENILSYKCERVNSFSLYNFVANICVLKKRESNLFPYDIILYYFFYIFLIQSYILYILHDECV